MLKKYLTVFVLSFCTLAMAAPVFGADAEIKVTLDDKPITFDKPPLIFNNRAMVPFVTLADAFDAAYNWDGKTRKLMLTRGDRFAMFQINDPALTIGQIVDGQPKDTTSIPLKQPPIIANGRTLIPVDAVSTAFDCEATWDDATKTISIKTQAYLEKRAGSKAYLLPETPYSVEASSAMLNKMRKDGKPFMLTLYNSTSEQSALSANRLVGLANGAEFDIYTLDTAKDPKNLTWLWSVTPKNSTAYPIVVIFNGEQALLLSKDITDKALVDALTTLE